MGNPQKMKYTPQMKVSGKPSLVISEIQFKIQKNFCLWNHLKYKNENS